MCDCLDLQPQRDFLFSHSDAVTGGAGAVLLPGHFPECFVWGLLCQEKKGSEAVSYLFRVAAGLGMVSRR